MDFKIAVIKGDGVGPEIVDEGLKVLDKIAQKYNHKFECKIGRASCRERVCLYV